MDSSSQLTVEIWISSFTFHPPSGLPAAVAFPELREPMLLFESGLGRTTAPATLCAYPARFSFYLLCSSFVSTDQVVSNSYLSKSWKKSDGCLTSVLMSALLGCRTTCAWGGARC